MSETETKVKDQQPAVTVVSKQHSTFGNESEDEAEGRDRWPSRAAFYLAAVGSAVGFGNVWRFPALAKDYGGGAFFIPYIMALLIVGIPVLILEISLGQAHQVGNVGVFGSFHPRIRGVGCASAACAFMLVVYYSILLSWVVNAFFDSFSNDIWTTAGTTGEEAVDYFYNDIVGMSTLGTDNRPTRVVWLNVGYSALCWLCVWGCLGFGMKWTGRIAYFTMGLPILFLFIFLFKAVTLEGASDGINEYIGKWDMSILTDRPDVWSTAVSQIFFSLSITFGTMTAYGSHCPRGEPAVLNSCVIGFSNAMFSFISGFAVFASLGHLSYLSGVPVDEVPYAGFSLVFGTWPVVFGSFSGGEHWVRLLFFNLFLLGIDSAFSILEAPITIVMDYIKKSDKKINGKAVPKWMVSFAFAFLAFLLSIMYATDAGLYFLDTVDFYINFVLLFIGIFETFSAGWVYGIEEQIETLGPTIVFSYMVANFGSVVIACGLWFGLKENAVWGGFLGGFLCYFGGIGATLKLMSQKMAQEPDKEWTWRDMIYEVSLKNVMQLREELESVVGYMPRVWAFGMKQIIPHILLILFINLASTENDEGQSLFGHYEGLETWPFQVLGILLVVFVASLILAGLALPALFEGADLTVGKKLHDVKKAEENNLSKSGDGDMLGDSEPCKDGGDPTATTPAMEDADAALEEFEA